MNSAYGNAFKCIKGYFYNFLPSLCLVIAFGQGISQMSTTEVTNSILKSNNFKTIFWNLSLRTKQTLCNGRKNNKIFSIHLKFNWSANEKKLIIIQYSNDKVPPFQMEEIEERHS